MHGTAEEPLATPGLRSVHWDGMTALDFSFQYKTMTKYIEFKEQDVCILTQVKSQLHVIKGTAQNLNSG